MKNIFYILTIAFILNLTSLKAQYNIFGQLNPKGDYAQVLLYKTQGAFQYYKASTEIDSLGMFGFRLPENFETGSYRLVYNTQKNLFVNIIYNQENVSFTCDPEDVTNTIYFFDSKENSKFFDYIKQINVKYIELDSIQNLCYQDYSNEKLVRKYISKNAEINAFQNYFEQETKGMLVNNFIKAYKKTNPELPLQSKLDYYLYLRKNYLNNIDFQNETLRNSSFIIDRLNEYVFDLNEAIAIKANKALDTLMIDMALDKIDASKFKDEVIYSLTSSAYDPYSSQYDLLLDYLHSKYYVSLPETIKTQDFTKMLESKLNVIVGKKAPNIKLDNGSLYDIKSDKIMIVFWSTTCSHCLKEIPEVYEFLKDDKTIKVILVAIEDEYSDWEHVIPSYPNWTHLRANGKWENEYAKAYNVKSTPAYFVLDKDKIIIAKPDDMKALKLELGK